MIVTVVDTLYQPEFQRSKVSELYTHLATLRFPVSEYILKFRTNAVIIIRCNYRLLIISQRFRIGVGVVKILPTPAPTKMVDSDRLQPRLQLRLHNPGSDHCRIFKVYLGGGGRQLF